MATCLQYATIAAAIGCSEEDSAVARMTRSLLR